MKLPPPALLYFFGAPRNMIISPGMISRTLEFRHDFTHDARRCRGNFAQYGHVSDETCLAITVAASISLPLLLLPLASYHFRPV